jgi:hypothetical protein
MCALVGVACCILSGMSAELVADCPRCEALSITFDVLAVQRTRVEYGWQQWFEAFSVCRKCSRGTILVICENEPSVQELERRTQGGLLAFKGALNKYFDVKGWISLRDEAHQAAPEYVPDNIAKIFREGATALAVECPNSAGTMFRLCVDLATTPLLPEEDVDGLNKKIRRDLGLRLPWLFDTKRLPESLRDLSHCIKEDGNDGAHRGTLTTEDAQDLLDFTVALLERMYTEPKRIEAAKARREARRKPPEKKG